MEGETAMYQSGDLVVYGTTGVCRVEEVTKPRLSIREKNREYYLLKPLHQDGIIYSPVDSEKVAMRPVMTREEAEALIARIPTIRAEAWKAPTLQALTARYQAAMSSHDSGDLVELTMSIYAKRRQAEANNRRLGMVDERYMKQAERLLYGELSVALEIPYEEVGRYIASRVERRRGDELPRTRFSSGAAVEG